MHQSTILVEDCSELIVNLKAKKDWIVQFSKKIREYVCWVCTWRSFSIPIIGSHLEGITFL